MSTLPPAELAANRAVGVVAADLTTRGIALIIIGLRFLARRISRQGYWWDDWMMLLTGFLAIPATVEEMLLYHWGCGRHIEWVMQFHPGYLPNYLKDELFAELMYALYLTPLKISILLFYIRLFGVNKKFTKICYIQIAAVVCWFIISEFVFLFQCNPIWVAWQADRSAGTCFEYEKLFLGTNAVNVIMDFFILITPLHCIWSLKMGYKQKILVTGVLIIGGCEVAFSAVRLAKVSVLTFQDPTWDAATALLWSTLEMSVATICANLPVLAPLLPKSWTGRGRGDSGRSVGMGYKKDINSSQSSRTDDEHELVGNNAMQIKQTAEFSVHEEPYRPGQAFTTPYYEPRRYS